MLFYDSMFVFFFLCVDFKKPCYLKQKTQTQNTQITKPNIELKKKKKNKKKKKKFKKHKTYYFITKGTGIEDVTIDTMTDAETM